MLRKLKFAVAALLGFSAACSSVQSVPRETAPAPQDSPEMKSDTTQELRVRVMYGVPAPRLTPEQIEELRSRADSLPPVLEQPADDMPDLSGASEQNPR